MITLVVFSMDRAMQLDSLLRSIADHVTGVDRVKAVVRASSARHLEAYVKLAADHPTVDQLLESHEAGCSSRLWHAMMNADHVGLAVDDMIFYRPSDYALAAKILDAREAFVWSWRLGHRAPARVDFHMDATLKSMWWSCSSITTDRDYGYVFHTDGSLYRRTALGTLLDRALPPAWQNASYSPNDIESLTVPEAKRMHVLHVGPIAPTCITWQLNKESTTKGEYGAPWCEIPETNLDAMADAFLAGKRVDNAALYADTSWTTRFNPPGARTTHVHACEEASRFYASLII